MGAGASADVLSANTQEEVAKLPEAARQELDEKKKLAEETVAEEKKKLAEELAAEKKEIERLRAELLKKDASPPSPVKQPLSEADAEAARIPSSGRWTMAGRKSRRRRTR